MTNRKTSRMQPQKEEEPNRQKAKRRARYFRRSLIIALEVVMILILSICCYGISLLNRMGASGFDRNRLYLASVENNEGAISKAVTEGVSAEVNTAEEAGAEQQWQSELQTEAETEAQMQSSEPETQPPVTEALHGENEVLEHQQLTNGYWNILLAGVDAKGLNSDTMIICSININTREIRMASVYRDTLLKMHSGDVYRKANAELGRSDYMHMMSMLNMNLDLRLTDIIMVNWAVLVNFVNAIGGIELNITEGDVEIDLARAERGEKTAIMQGYITEIVNTTGIYSPQIEHAGTQLCNGVWTLAYCRNRSTVDNDYGRTERQREVIGKVLDRTKELIRNGDYGVILSALTEATSNIVTSLTPTDILQLAMYVTNFNIGAATGFPFEKKAPGGTFMGETDAVIPVDLAANVVQLHRFLYDDYSYTPSDTVNEISYTIRHQTGF